MRSACRARIAVDEVVKVERVDLARIESAEALASVIEQLGEFGLVVLADQLSCSAAMLTLALDVAYPRARVHREQPTRRPRTAQRDLPAVQAFPLHGAARRSAHSFTVRCSVYNVYVMGRRGRQRARQATARAKAPRDRMARVQISDETWSAFRAGLGSTPVSVELGRLVEREVAGRRRRSASDAGDVRHAVDDARVVVAELSALIARVDGTQAVRPAGPAASIGSDVLFD